MRQNSVDLASLFEAAAKNLKANQQTINRADEYNGNHGTNMVDTFQTISSALEAKRGASTSTALSYAARQLGKTAHSGSGQVYAQNLARAAAQFKGRRMDERGALDLLQTLIGGGQGASAAQTQTPAAQDDEMMGAQLGGLGGHSSSSQPNQSGDLLGSLLGGLGGAGQQPGSQAPAPGGDLLGSLLGGLMGAGNSGGQAAGSQSGLDMNDLVTAAMAFMQAKQSGGSTQQALVQAFVAGSGMGRAPHREQSTELVVNSFLQALARGG